MPRHHSAGRETQPFPSKHRAAKDQLAKDATRSGSPEIANAPKNGFIEDIKTRERAGQHGVSVEPNRRGQMAEDANADLPPRNRG